MGRLHPVYVVVLLVTLGLAVLPASLAAADAADTLIVRLAVSPWSLRTDGASIVWFEQEAPNSGRYRYPISEELIDPATGLVTQYFERAVFEWHPENAEPYRVLLRRLAADTLAAWVW